VVKAEDMETKRIILKNIYEIYITGRTTELKKNPKLYFMDMGFRNYIIDSFNELAFRPDKRALVLTKGFCMFQGIPL